MTPVVTVRAAAGAVGPFEISVRWTGLRARIAVDGAPTGATVDIRRKAGDEGTRLIREPGAVPAEGEASVMVLPDHEDAEGTSVFVVVHDGSGRLLGQTSTTVGGGD